MALSKPIVQAIFLVLGLIMLTPGCVVEPREGYWDRDHNRWYHEHAWQACSEHDEHCR